MPGSLIPATKQRFFTNSGAPLANGRVTTYAAGTTSKKSTFRNRALTGANTNPIILDSRGEAVMFGAGIYRVKVETSTGAPIYDLDNVEAYAGVLDLILVDIADVEAARAAAIANIDSQIETAINNATDAAANAAPYADMRDAVLSMATNLIRTQTIVVAHHAFN